MHPRRPTRLALVTALLAGLAGAAPVVAQSPEIAIWPGAAPGSEAWTQREVEYRNAQGEVMVRNVVRPTLTLYLPDDSVATGTAMIVAPGGGFHFHSWETEGTAVAEWLQARGVAAFVLKYRLVDTGATDEAFAASVARLFAAIGAASGSDAPGEGINANAEIARVLPLATEDGRQAVRVVRQRAEEWGIAADRIGLMGFSAGGMVTVGVALQHDSESRPDFVAPIYAVPAPGIEAPADAPPMFALVAANDALAAGPTLELYAAWRAAGVPAELHVYEAGGHGFGMRPQGLPIDGWIERLGEWMGARGLMTRQVREWSPR